MFFNANAANAAAVSFTGSPAGMYGILGSPADLALDSVGGFQQGAQLLGVQNTDRSVLIRTDQKGALVPGSTLTVGGISYTAKSVLPIEDGLITLVTLA